MGGVEGRINIVIETKIFKILFRFYLPTKTSHLYSQSKINLPSPTVTPPQGGGVARWGREYYKI